MAKTGGWYWVPSTFFAEGAPFAMVTSLSVILFKSLDMSNESIAFWTGLIAMPWAFKPLWAPVLDLFGTKRGWIIFFQLVMALLFGAGALLVLSKPFSALLVALFFLIAFASATHDVAADGFYLIALDSHGQAFFAGIRGTFYRVALVSVQGGLVILAGLIGNRFGSTRLGWCAAFGLIAAAFLLLSLWHGLLLPRPQSDRAGLSSGGGLREFWDAFRSFLARPGVVWLIVFLFFFRIAEAQLGKMAVAFLKDKPSVGGLGLSLEEFGFLYQTCGVGAMIAGGVLGGFVVAHWGFAKTVWPLVAALNLPDLVYVYLSQTLPESRILIGGCIAVEQFGYGLGYAAFMLVTIAATEESGRFKTSHYAIMVGITILGLNLIGMASGWVQERLGYPEFFRYVMICTIPSFLVTIPMLKYVPRDFGCSRRSGKA